MNALVLPARLKPALYVLVVGVLIAIPFAGMSDYWVRQIVLVTMLALVVSGLNLTFGYAGELALGQAAVWAAGAYATGYFAQHIVNDMVLMCVVASAVSVIVGLLAGAPGLRLGGWMLAIGSFFLVLLMPDLINIAGDELGGYEGLTGIPLPQVFGRELDANGFYVAAIVIAALWFLLFRNLVLSPRGAEFRVLGMGDTLSSSLGVSTYPLKLKAYAIGSIPAGLAGVLFSYLDGYVSAVSFGLNLALMILAASVLGGMHTVYGAILGAALMQLGPQSSSALDEYSLAAFGAFLLLGGVLLPNGLTPLIGRGVRRFVTFRSPTLAVAAVTQEPRRIAGARLVVEGISKAFGGNLALDDVRVVARPGEVTALIGPNGSGKTTLLNVISGYYTSDSGTLRLDDRDIDGLSAVDRARAGVARTFQTPAIPEGLTVREVIRTGDVTRESGLVATMLRLPSYYRREREATIAVDAILASLGLGPVVNEMASALPLGTRRLVELGRALALRPAVLLLDEVASGLDRDEVIELGAAIRSVRDAGATVVLVEHNFDLIAAVSDSVFVLAEGRLLATGSPTEIAADAAVRATYLGAGPTDRRSRRRTTDLEEVTP